MPARTKRLARATLIACLAAAAVPAAASAANVAVSGGTLTFNAASHEANDVIVQKLAGGYRVSDNANTLTVGAGCTSLTTHQANCPLAAITLVKLNLLDQDDIARLSGVFNSQVFGGQGRDNLTGGGGNDLLNTGPGAEDRLFGKAGNDTLDGTAGGGPQVLHGGAGNDGIESGDAPTDTFFSGFFSQLDGGPGTDTMTGSSANELFLGGPGNDLMMGGSGGTSGFGGEAIDIVRYDDHTGSVTVTTGDAAANDGNASDGAAGARDKALQMEGIIGGSAADNLTGSAASDTLVGLGGPDTLVGGVGNDQICGDGFMFISVDSNSFPAACFTSSSDKNDNLNGGDGDDGLMGNGGADGLIGGPGTDVASWQDKSTRVVVTLGPGADGQVDTNPVMGGNQPENDTTGADVEDAAGGSGDDTLTGSAVANFLMGSTGMDTLNGLGGDDSLCGDTILFPSAVVSPFGLSCSAGFAPVGAASGDTLNGGDGDDRLSGNEGPDVLNGDLGIDVASYADKSAGVVVTVDAVANDGLPDEDPTAGTQPEGDMVNTENVLGGTQNDTLSGNGGSNALSGGQGTDTLNGMAGDDVLDPGGGNSDVVNGGGGFDYGTYAGPFFSNGVTITLDGVANDGPAFTSQNDNIKSDVEGALGTSGPDLLRGPATVVANTLVGYGSSDTLDGKPGDDTLTGGSGFDTLLGDAGNDLLSMVDGEIDSGDCGAGTGDRAMHDAGIETPTNCETLQSVTASAVSTSVADPRSAAFRAVEKTVRSMAALARR